MYAGQEPDLMFLSLQTLQRMYEENGLGYEAIKVASQAIHFCEEAYLDVYPLLVEQEVAMLKAKVEKYVQSTQ